MKIAFYKARYGKVIDFLIAVVTVSKYSHCELVFPDGTCASASPRDGGIRFKIIPLGSRWDVFELTTHPTSAEIREWFETHDGDTYDFFGAIGSAFGFDLTKPKRKFCSQSCASALKLSHSVVSPGRLFNLLKRHGAI